jgi:hypothetical protein
MAFLPFHRLSAAAAYANNSTNLYTQPLIVKNFVEVVAVLQVPGRMVGAATASFAVTPQVSNDMVNWADVATAFTTVTPASTIPFIEAQKISTLCWWMRFKMTLGDTASGNVAVMFSLYGDGKVDSEERESRESFFAALFAPSLGTAGKNFFPSNPYFPPLAGPAVPVPPGAAVAPKAGAPVPPTPSASGPSSAAPGEAPASGASGYENAQSFWSRPDSRGMYQIYHAGKPTGIFSSYPVSIPSWAVSSQPAVQY